MVGIILLIVLIGLVWFNYHDKIQLLFNSSNDYETVVRQFRQYGPLDIVLFELTIIVSSSVPGFPSSIVAVLAGVCFGQWVGFAMNIIGITVGNVIQASLLAILRKHIEQKARPIIYHRLLTMRHPRLGIILGYCVPIVPTFLVNLATARLRIRQPELTILCLLGSIPLSAIYSFGGNALIQKNLHQVIIILILLVGLAILITIINRDRRQRKIPKQ